MEPCKLRSPALAELQPAQRLVNPDLEWLAQLSLEEFREIFRGSPVKRAHFSGFRAECRDRYGEQR